jgi:hypothetical protein
VLVMLFMPYGIVGLYEKIKGRVQGRRSDYEKSEAS